MHKYSGIESENLFDLLSIAQLGRRELHSLIELSREMRSKPASFEGALKGRTAALIFEKPSLRTRVTFEVAVRQLGGWPILLGSAESRLGERESVPDVARNLSLWVDLIIARVFSHQALEELAFFSSIPVINALSDDAHPCQALADLLTLSDIWPSFTGKEVVYIGDWNNVSKSLFQVCVLAGLRFRAITPERYAPSPEDQVDWSADPKDVKGADAIYTDVWASMGQENEMAERAEVFAPYQVNEKLLAKTGKPTFFMHCLPAHRGLEVTDAVMESDYSLVFQQAANRLPVEKAVLVTLVENQYEAEGQKGGLGVLRRSGHLNHHSVAQGKLWM